MRTLLVLAVVFTLVGCKSTFDVTDSHDTKRMNHVTIYDSTTNDVLWEYDGHMSIVENIDGGTITFIYTNDKRRLQKKDFIRKDVKINIKTLNI